MENKDLFLVNEILKEWNPIDVDEPSLSDEYVNYIPIILEHTGNFQNLVNCLENILINKIGVSYDPFNEEHKSDLISVANKIYNHFLARRSV
jgi:hypothetical protein